MKTLEERFWEKVDIGSKNECWNWLGSKHRRGYGHFGAIKKVLYAHRVSWELHFGNIPDGVGVCHNCDNPSCVNPNHLFLGNQSDNITDAYKKGRINVLEGELWHSVHRESKSGESNGFHKLTEEEVRIIKSRKYTSKKLSQMFGVTQGAIYHVLSGRNWKYIE